MRAPFLSNMPLEILDMILSWLSSQKAKSLLQLVLLNRRIGSRAVKFLYQDTDRFFNCPVIRSQAALAALISSAKGETFFPYYQYLKALSFVAWHPKFDAGLYQLLSKLVKHGQLRDLCLYSSEEEFPRDMLFVPTLLEISSLNSVHVDVYGEFRDIKARSLVKTPVSKIRIRDLKVTSVTGDSLGMFELQSNTLRSLEIENEDDNANRAVLPQTLLASQSQSLTSLDLLHINLIVNSLELLPKLQTLRLYGCHVEGWENLCGSVPALKDLTLSGVKALGDISAFPATGLLEKLDISECGLKGLAVSWYYFFSRVSDVLAPMSFPSTRWRPF